MQIEFNKNLAQTLNEKKKELKQLKEVHYGEITSLKHKMNDAVSVNLVSRKVIIAFRINNVQRILASSKHPASTDQLLQLGYCFFCMRIGRYSYIGCPNKLP